MNGTRACAGTWWVCGLLAAAAVLAWTSMLSAAGPLPLARQRELAQEAGFRIVPAPDAPKPDQAPPKFPDDAVAAGAAIFVRDYNLLLYPESRVWAKELLAPAVIALARNETEPLSLGVRALTDLEDLTVAVVPVVADRAGPSVRVRYVEAAYIRTGGPRSRKAVLASLRVRPLRPLPLKKGLNRQFWIEATAGPQVAPGRYEYRIVVRSKGKADLTRPLTVQVRPYALARPSDRFIGAFCANEIIPDRKTFADWKDHGVEGMLWFWSSLPWDMKVIGGKLVCDFTDTEKLIDERLAAGLTGPVVIALGNDHKGHYERKLCRLYDRPLAKKTSVGGKTAQVARLDDEVINAAYMEGIRQFYAFLKTKKNWPEVVLLHYDEPTERLMPEATLRYKQIKQVAPDIRVYGVTMNRFSWAKMLAPISDILVCNGDYARISELGRKTGKAVWGYSSATAAAGFGRARFNMGLRLYRYGFGSHWFWCYDFYPGDPYNEFDSHTGDANWVAVYPGPTRARHVPTLAWEGLREAYDDLRYAATLEKLLAEKKGPTRDRIAAAYARFLADIPRDREITTFLRDQDDFYATLPRYDALTVLRGRLIAWIEELRKT